MSEVLGDFNLIESLEETIRNVVVPLLVIGGIGGWIIGRLDDFVNPDRPK